MNLRRLSFLAATAISTLLCVQQLIVIVVKYFAFESAVSTEFKRAVIPAFTLYYSMNGIKQFYATSRESLNDFNKMVSGLYSIPQIAKIPKYLSVIKMKCIIKWNKNWDENCPEPTARFSRNFMSLTYFDASKRNNSWNETYDCIMITLNSKLAQSFYSLSTAHNLSNVKKCYYGRRPIPCSFPQMAVHSPHFHSTKNLVNWEFGKKIEIEVTLKASFKMLPFPYTDCVDYKLIGYISRKHCFDNCVLRMLIKCRNDLERLNRELRPTVLEVKCTNKYRSICHQTCRKNDCELSFYNAEYFEVERRRKIPSWRIVAVNKKVSHFEMYRKMSVADALVSISGVLCFWFGLCMLGTFEAFYDAFESLFNENRATSTRLFILIAEYINNITIFIARVPLRRYFETRQILNIVMITICLIFALLQSYSISKCYFYDNEVIDFVMDVPLEGETPAITIRSEFSDFSLLNASFCKGHCAYGINFDHELSPSLLLKHFRNPREYVQCSLRISEGIIRDCFNVSHMTFAFRDYSIFVTLRTIKPYSFFKVKRNKSHPLFIIKDISKPKPNSNFRVQIYLHVRKSVIHLDPGVGYIRMNCQHSFRKIIYKWRPDLSDCIDYTKIGFFDDYECKAICIQAMHKKFCKSYAFWQPLYESSDTIYSRRTDCLKKWKITSICEKQCSKKPCVEEKYKFISCDNKQHLSDDKLLHILIEKPFYVVSYISRLKLEKIDVANSYLGSFSLWIGISFYSFFSNLLKLFSRRIIYEMKRVPLSRGVALLIRDEFTHQLSGSCVKRYYFQYIPVGDDLVRKRKRYLATAFVVTVCGVMAIIHLTKFLRIYFQYPIIIETMAYLPTQWSLPLVAITIKVPNKIYLKYISFFCLNKPSDSIGSVCLTSTYNVSDNIKTYIFLPDSQLRRRNFTMSDEYQNEEYSRTKIIIMKLQTNYFMYNYANISLHNHYVTPNLIIKKSDVSVTVYLRTIKVFSFWKTTIFFSKHSNGSYCEQTKYGETQRFENCAQHCLTSYQKNKTRDVCIEICFRNRCFTEIYYLMNEDIDDKLISSLQRFDEYSSLLILTSKTSKASFEHEHKKKYAVADLMNYIGHIVGCYFAISVFTLISFLDNDEINIDNRTNMFIKSQVKRKVITEILHRSQTKTDRRQYQKCVNIQ